MSSWTHRKQSSMLVSQFGWVWVCTHFTSALPQRNEVYNKEVCVVFHQQDETFKKLAHTVLIKNVVLTTFIRCGNSCWVSYASRGAWKWGQLVNETPWEHTHTHTQPSNFFSLAWTCLSIQKFSKPFHLCHLLIFYSCAQKKTIERISVNYIVFSEDDFTWVINCSLHFLVF